MIPEPPAWRDLFIESSEEMKIPYAVAISSIAGGDRFRRPSISTGVAFLISSLRVPSARHIHSHAVALSDR